MSKYGECECGGKLEPVWYEEKQTKVEHGQLLYTGYIRDAVSHLVCVECLKNYNVDDSFDGAWVKRR